MSDKKPTILYLIRHAQSVGNLSVEKGLEYPAETEFGSDLSELGEQQALELANELSNIPFDALYSSHLHRAEKTAQALAHRKNLTLTIVRDLQEADPRTENGEIARDRFVSAVNELIRNHEGQTIAVVAHGFVIRTFLNHLGHEGFEAFDIGTIDNTGYLHFEVSEDVFRVIKTKGLHPGKRKE